MPSILEEDLDEFSTRYWESCQDVLMETRSDSLVSRLSSPLPVLDTPIKNTKDVTSIDTKAALSAVKHYVSYEPSQFAQPTTYPQNGEEGPYERSPILRRNSTNGSIETVFTQTSPESAQDSGTVGERSFSKLKPRPKSQPKLLRRPSNVGNPFYRRNSVGCRDSSGVPSR